jgi:hypothetical protein
MVRAARITMIKMFSVAGMLSSYTRMMMVVRTIESETAMERQEGSS